VVAEQKLPVGLPVKVAAKIMGMTLPTAYRRVADGSLPLIPCGGRKRVPVAKLAELIGRPITAEEIAAAQAAATNGTGGQNRTPHNEQSETKSA